MDLKARAKKLKIDVPTVFLALKRKETPPSAKILAGIAVVYALSPIDLIPDFIPFIGYLDDLIILPFLIAFTIKLIPKDVLEECRAQAEGMWKDGKPKKWYYAVPVFIIWAIMIFIILKVFVK